MRVEHSPSMLAARAAGLQPGAQCVPAKAPGICVKCGMHYPAGTPVSAAVYQAGFTDRPSLALPSAPYECWACRAMTHRLFMQTHAVSVITPEGFYSLKDNASRASFFMQPPEPPFMVIINVSQQAHLVWRTPVNLSRQRYVMRVGPRLQVIRHPYVLAGIQAMRELYAHAKAQGITHGTTPWTDWKAQQKFEAVESTLDTRLLVLRPAHEHLFDALDALNHGERIAVATVAAANLAEPQPLRRVLPAPD